MEYECQLVSANRLSKGILDLQKPLCTRCHNKSCTNNIVDKKIAIMGVVHTAKLYNIGERFYFVVKCDGFMKEPDDDI